MQDNTVIATFYHFAPLDDFEAMREPLLEFCHEQSLKGTILLASEGINSTISGTREAIDNLFSYLKQDPRLEDIAWKESRYQDQPFEKMKVRLKKEIVRLAVDDLDMSKRGDYISAEEWDEFISRDDVVVIDTRNEYETRIGTFEGSIIPNTKNFRDFPEWAQDWAQDKAKGDLKVAMFCTGGVRCEKSTAYMKSIGFEHCYHLEGGILQYFETTENKSGKWLGECFVFDDRAAVDGTQKPTGKLICKKCSTPVKADDLKHGPKGKVWCSTCIAEWNTETAENA